MKLINSDDKKKTYQFQKDNYLIDFTLVDMGNFVGHRHRNFMDSVPEYWETMFVDIRHNEDKSKNINSSFLISDNGHLLRLIMVDGNNNQRTRLFYPNDSKFSKEEVQYRRGKGISNINGIWVQDSIGKTDDIFGPSYYYDEKTQQFVDKNGNIYPDQTPIASYELAQMITSAAQQTSKNYNEKIVNKNDSKETPDNIEDVTF